jgi:hypothetical protein
MKPEKLRQQIVKKANARLSTPFTRDRETDSSSFFETVHGVSPSIYLSITLVENISIERN